MIDSTMGTSPINRTWSPDYLVKWFFGQSEFWITAYGDKVLISKMGDGHAVNTLLMLERVASDIEPLINSAHYAHIQETELYQALYKKVMAAVGEAMPPLAEPEVEEWDTGEATPEYPWVYACESVRKLLEASTGEAGYDVLVDYIDRDGNETDNRRIKVLDLRYTQSIAKPFPGVRVLLWDRDDNDTPKNFYLSRIQRARRA